MCLCRSFATAASLSKFVYHRLIKVGKNHYDHQVQQSTHHRRTIKPCPSVPHPSFPWTPLGTVIPPPPSVARASTSPWLEAPEAISSVCGFRRVWFVLQSGLLALCKPCLTISHLPVALLSQSLQLWTEAQMPLNVIIDQIRIQMRS